MNDENEKREYKFQELCKKANAKLNLIRDIIESNIEDDVKLSLIKILVAVEQERL